MVAAADCSAGCAYGLPATSAGGTYTVAGDGTSGYSGDGGPATAAELGYLQALSVDTSGNLFIADSGNHRVRMVAATSCLSGCAYGMPATVAGDIYTIAGDGTTPFFGGGAGDGGPATSAKFVSLAGLAVDSAGNVLIADMYDGLRMVAAADCSTGCPYGLTSTGAGAIYSIAYGAAFVPTGVAMDANGKVLIADSGSNRVLRQ